MISLKHRMQVGNADLSLLLCLTWARLALCLWTMLDTSQRGPCFPSEIMVNSHRTDKFVHLFLVQNQHFMLEDTKLRGLGTSSSSAYKVSRCKGILGCTRICGLFYRWFGSYLYASLGDLVFSLSQMVLEFSQKQIGESTNKILSITSNLDGAPHHKFWSRNQSSQ